MNKVKILFLSCFLLLLCSCTVKESQKVDTRVENDLTIEKQKIVVTSFPIYDWVKNITQGIEDFDIILLQNDEYNYHNYKPTIEDIDNIQNSFLFIYFGGPSEDWIEQIEGIHEIKALCLKDCLLEENFLANIMDGDIVTYDKEISMDTSKGFDEHIWLSLKNARYFCDLIKSKIIEVYPSVEDIVETNYLFYANSMIDLDNKFGNLYNVLPNKLVIFGSEFPFIYLCHDYNISYYALSVCPYNDLESDRVQSIQNKLSENNLNFVCYTKGCNEEILNEIIVKNGSLNTKSVVFDSMENITSKDLKNGITYLDIMKLNLENLFMVLNNVK